ncbi:MAG: SDR family NAD(P)-dependent oxidoreductase [Spirochaetaceae bacterium]|jgi:NAD(P)-dependent dehydrogenase (short-subunit alcohol dehydrogenase family)|nr:SDR family NAD(P)-dependent oxidoreductase [Spirochaetaceae bacterium]
MAQKTIVISGASRGLGFCLAERLLQQDNIVHMIVRNKNEKTVNLSAHNPNCFIHIGDISSYKTLNPAIQTLKEKIKKIDVLYNVAAIFWPEDRKGILETNLDRAPEMFATNTCGPLRIIQKLADIITPETRIINISSESGSMENTLEKNLYAYSMSKAALNLATKIYWREKEGNCNIIVVDPGWMRTDMGGPTAHLDPYFSADSIIDLVDHWEKLEKHLAKGNLFFKYDGRLLPW